MGRRPTDSPMARMLIAGGIRREELAARAGCTLGTLGRIAKGRIGGMHVETLLRVAAALGCAVVELAPVLGVRPRGGLLEERGVTRRGGA